MAKRKKKRVVRKIGKIKVRRIQCNNWHVVFLRRPPIEAGGAAVDEVLRVVSINHQTKTITVMPGSPPCPAHKDVFREHK